MLPGLVLDTTGPDHLSVRETVEMADRRTASAAVRSARRKFVLRHGRGQVQPQEAGPEVKIYRPTEALPPPEQASGRKKAKPEPVRL